MSQPTTLTELEHTLTELEHTLTETDPILSSLKGFLGQEIFASPGSVTSLRLKDMREVVVVDKDLGAVVEACHDDFLHDNCIWEYQFTIGFGSFDGTNGEVVLSVRVPLDGGTFHSVFSPAKHAPNLYVLPVDVEDRLLGLGFKPKVNTGDIYQPRLLYTGQIPIPLFDVETGDDDDWFD